jgi:hypothetical protein
MTVHRAIGQPTCIDLPNASPGDGKGDAFLFGGYHVIWHRKPSWTIEFGESHASYMLNSNNQYDVDFEKK